MADTITFERLGVPAAAVGYSLLMNTTGRATARLQGIPGLPIVALPETPGVPSNMLYDLSRDELAALVLGAVDRVAAILTGKE